MRDLVAPQSVLVVGSEAVDDDGDGESEDEDADDGADAADGLAGQRGRALGTVPDWNGRKSRVRKFLLRTTSTVCSTVHTVVV